MQDNRCHVPVDAPGFLSGDPLPAPLADNGGPTLTHALESGSLAQDAGSASYCAAPDQRGVLRPQGSACDLGAFEAVVLELEAHLGSGDVLLDWNHSGDPWYLVWRSPAPYSGYYVLGEGPLNAYTDSAAHAADPAVNDYYRVSGNTYGGESNRVGVFTFALQPGS